MSCPATHCSVPPRPRWRPSSSTSRSSWPRKDHHGGRLPGPDRHRLVPLLRRRRLGGLRQAVARPDAVGRLPDARRGRGRHGLPRLTRPAPPSTARRSSSTAGCRSRRCRSVSVRTERGDSSSAVAQTVVQLMRQVERRPARDIAVEEAGGGRADRSAPWPGLQPAGQRLRRASGSAPATVSRTSPRTISSTSYWSSHS